MPFSLKNLFIILVGSLILSFFLGACFSFKRYSPIEVKQESEKLNAFFEKSFNENLSRHPELLTSIGRKEKYDELNDYSPESFKEELKIARRKLKVLKSFKYRALNERSKLNYLLFRQQKENFISDFKYRFYYYWLSSFFGFHTSYPTFMITKHSIENLKEAKAYIARLKAFRRVFNQIMEHLKIQEKKGIYPPAFVFPKVISASRNIISGKPFPTSYSNLNKEGSQSASNQKASPLYEDFLNKINQVKNLKPGEKKELKLQISKALLQFVGPAYKDFISYVETLSEKVKRVRGIWTFGDFLYKLRLQRITTTRISPEEVHQIGLKHVKRIHKEMEVLKEKLHFKGSLKDFFNFLRTNDQFYYPDTEAGRKAYLTEVRRVLKEMEKFMPKLFYIFPKTPLKVLPVEKFKEKTSGLAYYSQGSEDGKRPGKYYVNLSNMKKLPKYELKPLAYHEGLPGHHYQIALDIEKKDTPSFRRYQTYQTFTAFIEGWALYSEQIPKEIGLYDDEYSNFGRLSFELWRAIRLVVDSGIHKHRWTKEKAMKYTEENSPFQKSRIETSIERYFLLPGQATAYMIGMLKILELRDRAKKKLKKQFDLRAFHDEVLKHGPLPLDLLEEIIDQWIEKKIKKAIKS